jgi:hypothetical protein
VTRGWALAAAAGLAACSGPTEIVITVDTVLGVPCTIDALSLEVASGGGTITEEIELGAADLPGSITLIPKGAPGEVTVSVTGLREGAPLATAREAVSFDDGQSLELRFVLDRSCVPGPCPAVGVGGYDGLPPPAARRGCGEERYERRDSVFVVRDACEMNEALMDRVLKMQEDEDEVASPFDPPMPFPFRFYGEPVTQLWIGTNGYVGFGSQAPEALVGDVGPARSLGEPGFPAPGVLPFWDDLRIGPRGVCLAVSGQAPDRILWITWKEACFAAGMTTCGAASSQGTLTFTVALEETTDRIYVGYHTMTAGAPNTDRARGNTATIGITNDVPRGCPEAECSAEGLCASGVPCGYTEHSSQQTTMLPNLELRPL